MTDGGGTRSISLGLDPEKRIPLAVRHQISERIYYGFKDIVSVRWSDTDLLVEATADIADAISATAQQALASADWSVDEQVEVTFEHRPQNENEMSDPMGELVRRGDLLEHMPGVYTIGGALAEWLDQADRLFAKYARRIGAAEQRYPSTVAIASLRACGYLSAFPHLTLVAGALTNVIDPEVGYESQPEQMARSTDSEARAEALAPTVCYRAFEALMGSELEAALTTYSGSARCFRNEGGLGSGLDRLREFTMREIIWLGRSSEVERARSAALAAAERLVTELGLHARTVVATDAFFMESSKTLRRFQRLRRSKYELQVLLPHTGTWLACMSFNMHDSKLTEAFGIGRSGGPLASACFGVGLERFVYASCSQLGVGRSPFGTDIEMG